MSAKPLNSAPVVAAIAKLAYNANATALADFTNLLRLIFIMNLIKQSLYRQAFASDHSLPSDYNGSRIITIAAGRGTCCSYFCGYIMFPQPFTYYCCPLF
ncbi:hypothetical protein AB3W45_002034, partial [Neisseria gonorrhoeae]